MPTFKTLATSVGFTANSMDMVTLVAHKRSISRINFNQFYACLNCFVFKEDSQLIESPRVRTSALRLASLLLSSPISNPCQVINCNNFTLRFSLINNSATNVVVKPRLISCCAFKLHISIPYQNSSNPLPLSPSPLLSLSPSPPLIP